MRRTALQGMRVLDFTWVLAGPYATRILADFGAEVIKVQSKKTAVGAESNATGYFNTWNRNKRSITLDMGHLESRELALKLLGISDVIMENFTPRVMANWGLTYEKIKEVKSDIIMLSLSGMGQTGPWRDSAALGPTVQALSGITYLTSYDWREPVGIGYSYADSITGLFAALAVLAALEHRDSTGEGQYIDTSEYETMCSLLGPSILDYSANGISPVPCGNAGDVPAAPYGCYRCRGDDRWCVIAVFTNEEWHALCRLMGNPALAEEKKFASLQKRLQHADELNDLIGRWTVEHLAEQVVDMLQKAGVPSGVVNNAADLANDPQLKRRHFFVQLPHPALGDTSMDGTPIRLSGSPARFWRAAPQLGQDNSYVYRELLGLDDEEFRHFVEKGVIA